MIIRCWILEAALEENPALSNEELAIKPSSNHKIIYYQLQQLVKVPELGMNCLKTTFAFLFNLANFFWIDL